MTDVFARLRDERTPEAAQAEVEAMHRVMKEEYPAAYPEHLGYSVRAPTSPTSR